MGMESIEHIIFLMLENRSFDHYLGALTLPDEGRTDVDGLNNAAGFVNADTAGRPVAWWNMDGINVDGNTFHDPPHEMPEVVEQYAEGRMTGFVKAYQKFYAADRGHPVSPDEARCVMGYYTRKTLPVHYALADEFTICDRWFSSFQGSTWPNRLFAYAGDCGDMMATGDIRRFGAYTYPAYAMGVWEQQGLKWRMYSGRAGQGTFFDMWQGGPVYHSERGRDLEQFPDECQTGLAPLSIIEPDYAMADDHPPHHPVLGQRAIAYVVNALLKSPSWPKSLLVVTYDEHGGFADHRQPPGAPDAGPSETAKATLGFRVPAIIVSPFARPKFCSHTVFDHTSFLKTVNERWNLSLPGITRVASPGTTSLWASDCFDFASPPRTPTTLEALSHVTLDTSENEMLALARAPQTTLEQQLLALARQRGLENPA